MSETSYFTQLFSNKFDILQFHEFSAVYSAYLVIYVRNKLFDTIIFKSVKNKFYILQFQEFSAVHSAYLQFCLPSYVCQKQAISHNHFQINST